MKDICYIFHDIKHTTVPCVKIIPNNDV